MKWDVSEEFFKAVQEASKKASRRHRASIEHSNELRLRLDLCDEDTLCALLGIKPYHEYIESLMLEPDDIDDYDSESRRLNLMNLRPKKAEDENISKMNEAFQPVKSIGCTCEPNVGQKCVIAKDIVRADIVFYVECYGCSKRGPVHNHAKEAMWGWNHMIEQERAKTQDDAGECCCKNGQHAITSEDIINAVVDDIQANGRVAQAIRGIR